MDFFIVKGLRPFYFRCIIKKLRGIQVDSHVEFANVRETGFKHLSSHKVICFIYFHFVLQ